MKLSFAEVKRIQRLSQKDMSNYIMEIYKSGYSDGFKACKKADKEELDYEDLKAILGHCKGVGTTLYNRIIGEIERELKK